jgi:hypothetical protein
MRGVGNNVTARIHNLRLRTVRCGKTGKISQNLYWYKRIGKKEIYIGKEQEGMTFASCVACGRTFIKNRQNHIYCSNACACSAYYHRRKANKKTHEKGNWPMTDEVLVNHLPVARAAGANDLLIIWQGDKAKIISVSNFRTPLDGALPELSEDWNAGPVFIRANGFRPRDGGVGIDLFDDGGSGIHIEGGRWLFQG